MAKNKNKNTDPSAPWNQPEHRNDPFAPHNDPIYRDDPMKPWNDPYGSADDLSHEERKAYGINPNSHSEPEYFFNGDGDMV